MQKSACLIQARPPSPRPCLHRATPIPRTLTIGKIMIWVKVFLKNDTFPSISKHFQAFPSIFQAFLFRLIFLANFSPELLKAPHVAPIDRFQRSYLLKGHSCKIGNMRLLGTSKNQNHQFYEICHFKLISTMTHYIVGQKLIRQPYCTFNQHFVRFPCPEETQKKTK